MDPDSGALNSRSKGALEGLSVPRCRGSHPPAGGTPHRLAMGFFASQRRIEGGAGLQHGAGDVEKAIGH